MKAAIVPAVNEKWEVKEVPNLEPRPNQVLIKIHASGMCYTDVHQTKGELPGAYNNKMKALKALRNPDLVSLMIRSCGCTMPSKRDFCQIKILKSF
jgi:threonine dehydrogenase-like Zn-dependent dehydrogenase